MYHRALVILCMIVGAIAANAQSNESTQRVMERLLMQAGEDLCARAGDGHVRYIVTDHPDAQWIATMLRDSSQQRACISKLVDSLSAAQLVIVCRDVQTTYAISHHQDTVQRRIVVDLDAIDRVRASQVHAVRFVDTTMVARTDVPVVDSRQHMSTHGVVPPRPTTMWEDIAQPIVFIAAAVVTVVLLFTVRSQ